MKVEGGCHCGAIAFEAEVDPATVTICHCADCQTLSGSPYRASAPVKGENFKLTKGEPKVYVKVADSGNRRVQGFCDVCSSPIYSTMEGPNPPVVMVRVGVMHQRDQLIPQKEIWRKSAQSWATNIAGTECFDAGAPPPGKK